MTSEKPTALCTRQEINLIKYCFISGKKNCKMKLFTTCRWFPRLWCINHRGRVTVSMYALFTDWPHQGPIFGNCITTADLSTFYPGNSFCQIPKGRDRLSLQNLTFYTSVIIFWENLNFWPIINENARLTPYKLFNFWPKKQKWYFEKICILGQFLMKTQG